MAVLEQMLVFLILIVVGVVARRLKLITEQNQSQLSGLVVNIAYPALILSGALGAERRVEGVQLLVAVGSVVALIALAFAAAAVLPVLLRYPRDRRVIYTLMTVFTNIGFMGVPMIRALYGPDALIYMTIFLVPFNLLFYAYAIPALQGKTGRGGSLRTRDLLNSGMAACVLAIAVYLSGISVPRVLVSSVDMVGDLTAPLGMMLLGSFLLDVDWRTLLTDARIWLFCALKMVVVPVAIVALLGLLVQDRLLLAVCLAALSTPSGNVLALLANLYRPELAQDAVKGIALTTVASVGTMPLCFYLLGLS